MNDYLKIGIQCCIVDEGRPLEIGLQELVSNHRMLLQLRVVVVSDTGKGSGKTGSDNSNGDDRKETIEEVSKTNR